MFHVRFASIFTLILLSGLVLASCANKQLNQMQQSVSELENRVYRYQKETATDSEQTTSTLGEMNATISKAFQDIRYSQTNLETMIEQISTRMGRLERDVENLKDKVNQLDTFSADSYAKLNDGLNQSKERLQTDVNTLQNALNGLTADLNELKQKTDTDRSRLQQTQSRLETRMSDIESTNQTMYRRILKELGAAVPEEPTPSKSNDSKVHIVENGETLSRIAVKYGIEMETLKKLNGIDDPSKILVGQKIRLP